MSKIKVIRVGAIGKRKEHLYFHGGHSNEVGSILELFEVGT